MGTGVVETEVATNDVLIQCQEYSMKLIPHHHNSHLLGMQQYQYNLSPFQMLEEP